MRANNLLILEIQCVEANHHAGWGNLKSFQGYQVVVIGGPFKGMSAKVMSSDISMQF
tara:strand:+ start:503 stop:673 length:171 start_codon:yes stop_codon:yes gene_type:complete